MKKSYAMKIDVDVEKWKELYKKVNLTDTYDLNFDEDVENILREYFQVALNELCLTKKEENTTVMIQEFQIL